MIEQIVLSAIAVFAIGGLIYVCRRALNSADIHGTRDAKIIAKFADVLSLSTDRDLQARRIEHETVGAAAAEYTRAIAKQPVVQPELNGWKPPQEDEGIRVPSHGDMQ